MTVLYVCLAYLSSGYFEMYCCFLRVNRPAPSRAEVIGDTRDAAARGGGQGTVVMRGRLITDPRRCSGLFKQLYLVWVTTSLLSAPDLVYIGCARPS